MQMGNNDLAMQNLTRAVELKPSNIGALNDLAWLLATTGDVTEEDANRAIEYARRACELTGNKEFGFLDTLAAAYAAAGRFPEAVSTAEKALSGAKAARREDLAGRIQNRLELYRNNRPYHDK
jgi:Flp pilus assembly protein TadD